MQQQIASYAPKFGDSSPWGQIDCATQIAPGIIRVSTPSHGGIWVAPELRRRIDSRWLERASAWFEEDCEWAIVAHSFPEEFGRFHDADRKARGAGYTGDEVLAMADRSLRAWMPDAYELITGQRVEAGQSRSRDALKFAQEHPDGLWLGGAFGDWHGLVPKGLIGAYADVGNAATIRNNGGGEPGCGGPAQVTILVTEVEYNAARDRHGWLGEKEVDAFEPWPVGAAAAGLYSPLDHLRGIRLQGQSDSEALMTLATLNPGIAAVLYAKDGNFERATELLQPDFADSVAPRNAVLWLAARAGEGVAIGKLLDAGADPTWNDHIAARAAEFHGHHNEARLLNHAARPAAVRTAGMSL